MNSGYPSLLEAVGPMGSHELQLAGEVDKLGMLCPVVGQSHSARFQFGFDLTVEFSRCMPEKVADIHVGRA